MTMHEILKVLSSDLEAKTKQIIQRRVDSLMRGVKFEKERNSPHILEARKNGWNIEKIEIICCLNAFYQIVLGPLASPSRSKTSTGLLTEHDIKYGKKVHLNSADIDIIGRCHDSFVNTIKKLGIDFWCLQANHAQDLIFRLSKNEKS